MKIIKGIFVLIALCVIVEAGWFNTFNLIMEPVTLGIGAIISIIDPDDKVSFVPSFSDIKAFFSKSSW